MAPKSEDTAVFVLSWLCMLFPVSYFLSQPAGTSFPHNQHVSYRATSYSQRYNYCNLCSLQLLHISCAPLLPQ